MRADSSILGAVYFFEGNDVSTTGYPIVCHFMKLSWVSFPCHGIGVVAGGFIFEEELDQFLFECGNIGAVRKIISQFKTALHVNQTDKFEEEVVMLLCFCFGELLEDGGNGCDTTARIFVHVTGKIEDLLSLFGSDNPFLV